MEPDDVAYRKSVRNMALVLAAIVITIFAAIFIPLYVNPSHNVFQQSVSSDSPFGFTMHLNISSTIIDPSATITLVGWVNSTSSSIENVSAADSWAFPQGDLWGNGCAAWPIGLGVMRGHFTQDNYTLGTSLQLAPPRTPCPSSSSPAFFLFYPLSSKALAGVRPTPVLWVLQTTLSFGEASLVPGTLSGATSGELPPGVYTAFLADEWGDVLTTNFVVS